LTKPTLDLSPRNMRTFGITMAVMLVLFSGIAIWKQHWTVAYVIWGIAGIGFLLPALLFPTVLKPAFRGWMKIALFLGYINSRILLSLCFYLMFTPIGLVQRISGRDALELKLDPNAETYWHDRSEEEYKPKHFERQF